MPKKASAPDLAGSEARGTQETTGEDTPYEFKTSWGELCQRHGEVYAYSVKAWYTHGRAHTHGIDPLEPREPTYYGPEVRLAGRMCDLAAHPRHHHLSLDELADVATRSGLEETEREKSARLGWWLDQRRDIRATLRDGGIPAVLDMAELTHEERNVCDLVLAGRDQTQIVEATGKALGTVKVLRKRAVDKLHALAVKEVA